MKGESENYGKKADVLLGPSRKRPAANSGTEPQNPSREAPREERRGRKKGGSPCNRRLASSSHSHSERVKIITPALSPPFLTRSPYSLIYFFYLLNTLNAIKRKRNRSLPRRRN